MIEGRSIKNSPRGVSLSKHVILHQTCGAASKSSDSWKWTNIILFTFSRSLIIHQVKTNKIIAVKEVWMPGLNQHSIWQFYSSVYSLVFVFIEKVYQTLETVSLRLSKHIEVLQKYSAARRIINSLPSVWICVHTRSFVFHILPGYITKTIRSILKTYKLHSEIYLQHTNITY